MERRDGSLAIQVGILGNWVGIKIARLDTCGGSWMRGVAAVGRFSIATSAVHRSHSSHRHNAGCSGAWNDRLGVSARIGQYRMRPIKAYRKHAATALAILFGSLLCTGLYRLAVDDVGSSWMPLGPVEMTVYGVLFLPMAIYAYFKAPSAN